METRSRQMRCTNVTVRFCITQHRLKTNNIIAIRVSGGGLELSTKVWRIFYMRICMRTSLTGEVTPSNSPRRTVNDAMIIYSNNNAQVENLDHYSFPGNCPPTPPLSQHFALSEK